jgi:hypothetical protein
MGTSANPQVDVVTSGGRPICFPISSSGSPPGAASEPDVWFWVAGGALAVRSAKWLVSFRRIGS